MNEHNKLAFISCLVRYRDYFLEEQPDFLISEKISKNLNDILSCYFNSRRPLVLMSFSSFFSNKNAAEYINDVVLDYIYEEVDVLCFDWRQMYVLKEDEENLYKESEEDYL